MSLDDTSVMAAEIQTNPWPAVSRDQRTGERHAIFILGMHRSGTSALTRTLGFCGAALPHRRIKTILGKTEEDFWEPRVIRTVHDELLHSIDLSALEPSDIPPA